MLILGPWLLNAYKNVDLENLQLGDEVTGREFEKDILSLGGPKTNRITQLLLRQLESKLPFSIIGHEIIWDGATFCGDYGNDEIINDYGYVVRTKNPFNPESRITIIGSSHTYGVIAAARWLVTDGCARKLPDDIAVLVKADIIRQGHVAKPQVICQTTL